MFQANGIHWLAYGDFSAWYLIPNYEGPRPSDDAFIPYGGSLDKLGAPKDTRLQHAFRAAMLLNGVDLPRLGGMTMAAHTEDDVDRTVEAVAATLEMLRDEGYIMKK